VALRVEGPDYEGERDPARQDIGHVDVLTGVAAALEPRSE